MKPIKRHSLQHYLDLPFSAMTLHDVLASLTFLKGRKDPTKMADRQGIHPEADIYLKAQNFFRSALAADWSHPLSIVQWSTVQYEMSDYPGPLKEAWEALLDLEAKVTALEQQASRELQQQLDRRRRLLAAPTPWNSSIFEL